MIQLAAPFGLYPHARILVSTPVPDDPEEAVEKQRPRDADQDAGQPLAKSDFSHKATDGKTHEVGKRQPVKSGLYPLRKKRDRNQPQ